jgi:CHAT domain-containing protein
MKHLRVTSNFRSLRLARNLIRYGLAVLLGGVLALTGGFWSTVVATIPPVVSIAQISSSPASLLAQGQEAFAVGRYEAAAQAWQQAADGFAAQGEIHLHIRSLNNLSQAYQQLGRWAEATSALAQSRTLLAAEIAPLPTLWGQTWMVQGGLDLAQARTREALAAFQQATEFYQAAGDDMGILRGQVNQARALRAMGLYRQAIARLEDLELSLTPRSPSVEAAAGFRTLGELYRTVGNLEASQAALEAGVALAEHLGDEAAIAASLFSLAPTLAATGDRDQALAIYDQVVALSPRLEWVVRAQVAQLSLQAQLNSPSSIRALVTDLTSLLPALPAGRLRAYALIEAANVLVEAADVAHRDTALTWLTEAMTDAQAMSDWRAESYAVGTLGKLYRQAQRWEEAKTLTQEALGLALKANAPEVSYLWNAQLGDLQRETGETTAAIANYTAAVNTLETLRRDLVAIDDDVRYNFRETVEPVYRHLVDLLTAPDTANQPSLQDARAVMEALQLAELENFFREACLPISENIDQVVDSTTQPTAVLYPIILPDRLEVVLKLPNQPLTHFATAMPQADLEAKLQQLRQDVVLPYTLRPVQAQARELYRWLVEPALPQLTDNHIGTLVFVLDGALRNIPMGLLYDGERYLIEDFRIAIAPGLQLVAPQALAEQNLSVIIAGISDERTPFPPLPYVAEEVKEVETALSSQVLLNQTFTVDRLETVIRDSPFPVVHLATHGRFSSNPEDTFILAWDDQIPLMKLNSILRNSEQSRQSAIELLVLSACETATGDDRAALGLAGVAVRAGARSTVASLWNLDDETTALAMNQFYNALKNPGTTRAEALRQAQLSLLHNPNFAHPRHWAPYVLIGNWL